MDYLFVRALDMLDDSDDSNDDDGGYRRITKNTDSKKAIYRAKNK